MEIIKGLVLQFEYKFWTYYGTLEEMFTQNILNKENVSIEYVFNELGKDGWELFTILQGKENCLFIFIFKRSKWVEKKAQEKQEKQDDNSNKVERKFKVGDWIVNQHGTVRHIEEVGNVGYQTDEGWLTHDCYEKDFRLWSIADAKDGDILSYENEVFTVKKSVNLNILYYCCYDGEHFIIDSFYSLTIDDINNIRPATKEQRDLLFQKMHEAGYEWDDKEKKPIKIEATDMYSTENYTDKEREILCEGCEANCKYNHATWSEEDEKMFVGLTTIVEGWYNSQSEKEKEYYGDCGYSNWLQSLKDRVQPQPKKQWSKEEKSNIDIIVSRLEVDIEYWKSRSKRRVDEDKRIINWLLSLKPQNRWKPSEGQIIALRWVLNNIPYNKHKEEISGLLDQIKYL